MARIEMQPLLRLIEPNDFTACMAICDLSRFSRAEIQSMGQAWRYLLPRDEMRGVVVEDLSQSKANRIVAFGTTVFASDEWMLRLQADPKPGELTRLLLQAGAPGSGILDYRQIGLYNAQGGLNVVCPLYGFKDFDNPEYFVLVAPLMIRGYQDIHAGFRLRELLGEALAEAPKDWCLANGDWHLRSDYAEYFLRSSEHFPSVEKRSWLIGATRQESPLNSIGWCIFSAATPAVGFSETQKRVFQLARLGHSNSTIAEQLGVSKDAVRKCFRIGYQQLSGHAALCSEWKTRSNGLKNDKQKRERFVEFLRNRPEEVRPWRERPRIPRHSGPVFLPPQKAAGPGHKNGHPAPHLSKNGTFDVTGRIRAYGLTPREAEVMGWIKNGKSDAQIAEILDLSKRTVQEHLQNTYKKLGVESRTAALIQLYGY